MKRKTTLLWIIGAFLAGLGLGNTPDQPTTENNVDTTVVEKPDKVAAPPNPKTAKQIKTRTPDKPKPAANLKPVTSVLKPRPMYVDADRLNVRNGPGLNNNQVWTLKRDEKVTVVEQSGEWLKVKGSRYAGWVFGTYLTPKPAPNTAKLTPAKPIKKKTSDKQIKKILIRRSISQYNGRCPCPYNTKSNGHRCGGNSAYLRPGGASPLCYPSDITAGMIRDYRARL